jgi:hypothetical protein
VEHWGVGLVVVVTIDATWRHVLLKIRGSGFAVR